MEVMLLMIKARRWEQGEGDAQKPGDVFITLWTWEEYKRQGHCMGILQSIFHVLNKEYDKFRYFDGFIHLTIYGVRILF